jgi:ribosome recycling factor
MHDINQTAFAQRRELMNSVDMRLQSSRDSLRQIQANAKELRADARAEFKTSLDAVKAREKELEAAAKAARNSDEPGWSARRADLARAHQAHLDAIARLEATVRPPTP